MKSDRVCAREVRPTTSAETEVGKPRTVDKRITNAPAHDGRIQKRQKCEQWCLCLNNLFFVLNLGGNQRKLNGGGRGSVKSSAAAVTIACHSSNNLSFD